MRSSTLFTFCAVSTLLACGGSRPAALALTTPQTAVASLESRSGSTVTGTVTFTRADSGLNVTVELSGASPGKHAVHVHEKGDCSAPDGSSAGSHFNPLGHEHGAPDGAQQHAGDFGNVEIGEDGKGTVTLTARAIRLGDGETNVLGRAVIVHANHDDFSQPVGNAGGRQACGVIVAK